VGDGLSEGVGEGEGLGDGVGDSSGSGVGVTAPVAAELEVLEEVVDGLRVVVVVRDGGGGGGTMRPEAPGWPAWLVPGCAGASWPAALSAPGEPACPGGPPAPFPSSSSPMLSPWDAGPLMLGSLQLMGKQPVWAMAGVAPLRTKTIRIAAEIILDSLGRRIVPV
jgi:hypothetical protein